MDSLLVFLSTKDFEEARGLTVSRFELVQSSDNPFKVGDKVMLKGWEKFYEIFEIKGDKIKIKSSSGEYYWYSTSIHNFEKESTMKFDPSKKYRMVDTHVPVRIICTDKKDPATPYIGLRAADPDYEVVMYLYENDSRIEEVPHVDWSKVEVDTLVWAGTLPRYFQGYCRKEAKVYFWRDGTTSVTNGNGVSWEFAKKCSLEKPNA